VHADIDVAVAIAVAIATMSAPPRVLAIGMAAAFKTVPSCRRWGGS